MNTRLLLGAIVLGAAAALSPGVAVDVPALAVDPVRELAVDPVTAAVLVVEPPAAGGAPVDARVRAARRAYGPAQAPPEPSPEPAPEPAPAPGPPATPPPDPGTPADGTRTAEGHLLAEGSGVVAGALGAVRTYTVEIADGLEGDQPLEQFAAVVEQVLSDDARGWTASGQVRLQRTDDVTGATVRVLLASPATVDRLCARAGLRTNGLYSCWNGRFAAINSTRWFRGVDHVDDQELYRAYVINHEVGHGLGHAHRSCPGAGRLAPVMMQLTKSTYGCEPNAWPFP